jgi:hypothetical protein
VGYNRRGFPPLCPFNGEKYTTQNEILKFKVPHITFK